MAEPRRTLEIRLVLASHEPISPSEFLDIFRCGDEFSRFIAQSEALELLDDLDVPTEERLATLRRLHQLGKKLPSPAEVQQVEKGSWIVVLTIASPALLFMLKEYLHPVVKQAWDESDMRQKLLTYLQERVFRKAKLKAEEKAIQTPRYGNLQILTIEGESVEAANPSITIRMERRTVIEVKLTDRDLIHDFVGRLRNR